MNLLERYRLWKKKRYWAARKMEHFAFMIEQDGRWMAHDPVAAALTARYAAALREDWYKVEHEDVGALRARLGLTPRYAPVPEASLKHIYSELHGRGERIQH